MPISISGTIQYNGIDTPQQNQTDHVKSVIELPCGHTPVMCNQIVENMKFHSHSSQKGAILE